MHADMYVSTTLEAVEVAGAYPTHSKLLLN